MNQKTKTDGPLYRFFRTGVIFLAGVALVWLFVRERTALSALHELSATHQSLQQQHAQLLLDSKQLRLEAIRREANDECRELLREACVVDNATNRRLRGWGSDAGQVHVDIALQCAEETLQLAADSGIRVYDELIPEQLRAQINRDVFLQNWAAICLATERQESMFNPSATAGTTSASGAFQLVRGTAEMEDLNWGQRFNHRENAAAGMRHLERKFRVYVVSRLPAVLAADADWGSEVCRLCYWAFHDGDLGNSGGREISQDCVVPVFQCIRTALQRRQACEETRVQREEALLESF